MNRHYEDGINYYGSQSSPEIPPHDYRLCDQCGLVEVPPMKFKLCGACLITRYCSTACQKLHWPSHKRLCQHTVSVKDTAGDGLLARSLRKFTSSHSTLLAWAGFQALELKTCPDNLYQQALLIVLHYQPSHGTPHLRFRLSATSVVPRTYICDSLVNADIQRREIRSRSNNGVGTLIVIIQCESLSQVMPVEIDAPVEIAWNPRDDWEKVLADYISSGQTDSDPISEF